MDSVALPFLAGTITGVIICVAGPIIYRLQKAIVENINQVNKDLEEINKILDRMRSRS